MENLAVNPYFWRGKRVLVTGHSGFKGGWLALSLQILGAKVAGFSLPASTEPSLYEIADVAKGMDSTIGDVRDAAALMAATKMASPEIIIHMAAQPIVRQSYVDPVGTYATNVMGTVNVLEAARSMPSLRAVVIVTSDKCYENTEDGRFYSENDGLGGSDPYSSSKACAELVTAAYRRSFFSGKPGAAAVATARAGNVIGGGDWAPNRLVPDAIRAFSNNERLKIRYPQSTRPWQHVLDALSGYLLLAERLCTDAAGYSEPWNFGPAKNSVTTVGDVATAVARKWGNNATWEADGTAGPHEARYLGVDAGKAQTRLGWKPRLDTSQAVDWTVEWYAGWRDGADMRRFTESQIERYLSTEKT